MLQLTISSMNEKTVLYMKSVIRSSERDIETRKQARPVSGHVTASDLISLVVKLVALVAKKLVGYKYDTCMHTSRTP